MERATRPGQSHAVARIGTLMVIVVIALVLLGLTISSWRSISPGYVGIVFDKANHNVTAGALEPGWAFINPFTQALQEYPITIQNYSMVEKSTEGQTAGDDSIKVQSNEGQQINLDVVIQYQVIKEESGLLYQDWGGADITLVEDRVVRQYTRSQVPVVASKYGWEEITSIRIRIPLKSAVAIQRAERNHVSYQVKERYGWDVVCDLCTPFEAIIGAGQDEAATTEICRHTPEAVRPGR